MKNPDIPICEIIESKMNEIIDKINQTNIPDVLIDLLQKHSLNRERILGMSSDELARRIGLAWERLPEPRHAFSLEIITPDRPSTFVNLGPHPPRLWPEDIDKLHDLWLRLSADDALGSKLHHRDVVGLALRLLEKELSGPERESVLQALSEELGTHAT